MPSSKEEEEFLEHTIEMFEEFQEKLKPIRHAHPTVRLEKLEEDVSARFKEIELSIRTLQNTLLDVSSRAERSVKLVQEFGQRLAKLELS